MRLAPEVSIAVDRDAAGGIRRTVAIDGRPTEARTTDSVLEAAVACDHGWLLFLTDDTPFEEMLRIVFVGTGGRLLDAATIGAPYATGSFSSLALAPPDTVRFRFIDDADWSVHVFDRPRLAVPFLADARGVWRGFRLARRFRIDRAPR